jgi:hypothetical protein
MYYNYYRTWIIIGAMVRVMVITTNNNNISVLLVEGTGVPWSNHRPVASYLWIIIHCVVYKMYNKHILVDKSKYWPQQYFFNSYK